MMEKGRNHQLGIEDSPIQRTRKSERNHKRTYKAEAPS